MCLVALPDAQVWLGPKAIVSQQTVQYFSVQITFNLLNLLPASDQSVYLILTLVVIASLCMISGFLSRIACFFIFLCLLSFYHRDPLIMNSGDTYMRQTMFWMIFTASGMSLSLDRWLKDRRNKTGDYVALASAWPLRLLQLQFCLVYCHTFFSKIVGEYWLNGSAIYYSSRLTELQRLPIPYLFDHMWTCQLLTWSTLLLEYSLFTLIWIKPLRYPILGIALIFHLMIDWTMNIPQFEWLMIFSLILFVDGRDLEQIFDWLKRQPIPLRNRQSRMV